MHAHNGAFFVIEGTDGSGKATQFAILKKRLEAEGYQVATFDFPQYTHESSYFVREYLKGSYGDISQVGPYAGSLLYALDRFQAAKRMREALDKGYIVLANRFTGSNMAHQGSKFTNPSERRGYYIWVDSMEYMVLGIPRPDMNVVLRVPAKIAQTLVERRAEARNVDRLDIHERDTKHISATVQVYDELCQLFPKDFKQIDCVRGGALMSVEQIEQMLWETIRPHLPTKPTEQLPALEPVYEQATTQTGAREPLLTASAAPLRMSIYAAAHCAATETAEKAHLKKGKRYYIPATLKKDMRTHYCEVMDSLFELYDEMHFRMADKHTENLRAALPLATLVTCSVDTVHANVIQRTDTPEFRKLRAALHTKQGEGPSAFTRGNTIARLASNVLPSSYGQQSTKRLMLVSVTPRNELDTVPYILYPTSEMSMREISEVTKTWSYEQKSTIYTAYLATKLDSAHALDQVVFTFDTLLPFTIIRDLQRLAPEADLTWQQPSPRLGYEMPESIEDAGLLDLFERSFSISVELYSELQAKGLHNEAIYATLLGYDQRCIFRITAWDLRSLLESTTDVLPETSRWLADLTEQVLLVHPLLVSNVNQS